MKFTRLLLILFIIPIVAFGVHKYYISMTKVDYIKNEKAVQITMRYFIDDVETTLNKRFDKSFELATQDELQNLDAFLKLYIDQKFHININGIKSELNMIGKEYENDVIFIYLEIENVDSISSIEVQNIMLMEEFEEQQNYIKLNINNKNKTFILTRGDDKNLLNF